MSGKFDGHSEGIAVDVALNTHVSGTVFFVLVREV